MATMTKDELTALLTKNPSLLEKNPELAALSPVLQKEIKKKKQEKEEKSDRKSSKSNKYKNVRQYLFEDGFVSNKKDAVGHGKCIEKFDSIKEYKRWNSLKLLEQAGAISDLQRQKEFILQEAFEYHGEKIRAITYKADFVYRNNQTQQMIVEDVKGYSKASSKYMKTKDFELKWKMMKYKYSEYNLVLI